MILIPAIDILNNKCVRLKQGDYSQLTIYHDNPEDVAKQFEKLGLSYIHVVDLDGAKQGKLINLMTIQNIIHKVSLPIQVGGGIRSIKDARILLAYGVDRIIIGTSAIEDLKLLEDLVSKFGSKVAVGIDAKDGYIQTRGWLSNSKIDSISYIEKLVQLGIKTIIYTDIAKDGMLQGPNFGIYKKLGQMFNINIIASGGISSIDDLTKLKEIGLYGAIIGKAYYEGKLDLKEAITCLQEE